MLFSWDCIQYIIRNQNHPKINEYDDRVLSYLALDYCDVAYDFKNYYVFLVHNTCRYELITELSTFFRIKNPDREEFDLRIWDDLYNMFA